MNMKGRYVGFWFVSLLLMVFSHQVSANSPFYFIAKPVQPITGNTPSAPVYLRWDTLESSLPDDVVRIELLRDGQVLLNKAVNQVQSATEIMALYQRSGQERQLLQTLTNLQELAFSEDKTLNLNNYAEDLRQRIVNDNAYAYLASRQDFNVALARYRAYIDKPSGSASYNYELVAINGSGVRARLGLVTVDMAKSYKVLGATDFKQVPPSRCDSPDYFKYNYSVALGWKSPGQSNQIDALTSDIAIAGYDLYRTKDNLLVSIQTPPQRDIAALAATSSFNAQGQWILPGLEKVNRLPLMITADNTDDPEWLETKDQLVAAGLKPGDRRGYYLVPKDFTGQYGPTISAIVVVPNLVRPQAPWDVDLYADETKINGSTDKMILSWDAVNYENFIDTELGQKQICNTQEAEKTGFIEYVNAGENCQTDTRRSIRVDVDKYLVYRFDSFEKASVFKDSDGDGVADLAEQPSQIQCNPVKQPPNTEFHLINPSEGLFRVETYTVGNRQRKRISVSTTDNQKGQVYWYRIASRTKDNRLSFLSEPIRALFPDRNLPDKPTVEISTPDEKICGCRAELNPEKQTTSILDPYNLNYTGDFTLSCEGTNGITLSGKDFSQTGLACTQAAKTCTKDKAKSLSLDGSVTTNGSAPYPLTCSVDLPSNFDLCGTRGIKVLPEMCTGLVPVATGELISGPMIIVAKAPEGSCVSIYRNMGGETARAGTSCGTTDTSKVEVAFDQGLFCGYAVSHDKNNNISQAQVIPCVLVQNTTVLTPSVPQLVDLTLNTDAALVSWRNPLEPVAVTLIEMTYTAAYGETSTSGVSVPSAGQGSASIENYTIPIPSLTESPGRLCVRVRAISPNAKNTESQSSPWSAQICEDILPNGQVAPDYLPWPVAESISRGKNTRARLGKEFVGEGRIYGLGAKFVDLFDFDIPNNDCRFTYTRTAGTATVLRVFPLVECTLKTKSSFDAKFGEYASFIVYRQSGDVNSPGDWIQVSPLIDYAHWDYKGIKNLLNSKDKRRFYELNDPYIKLYYERDNAAQTVKWKAAVIDRYPYDLTKQHRYQIVYFDDTHRIVNWRLSDWFDPASTDTNGQQGGQGNE